MKLSIILFNTSISELSEGIRLYFHLCNCSPYSMPVQRLLGAGGQLGTVCPRIPVAGMRVHPEKRPV